MYHYIYRIQNNLTKEYYIGVRTCRCDISKDPYMGSSSLWTRAFIKENRINLTKEILLVCDTREEADAKEVELRLPFKEDPLCVNILFDRIPSALGKVQTEEHVNKRKLVGDKNGMYGKHHTEASKRKISEAQVGKVISEGTKLKMSAWQKGKPKPLTSVAKQKATLRKKYDEGYLQATAKPVVVEDLLENTITEYPSNTDFCAKYGFDKQSLGVFIRKGYTYKKRFKVRYKELVEDPA